MRGDQQRLLSPHQLGFPFLLGLWNSVCGLLLDIGQLIENGLVSLSGPVWRVEDAAMFFFDHLGTALLRLAVSAFTATVGALKAAASAVVQALAALAEAIIKQLSALISPVVNSFLQALQSLSALT